MITEVNKRRHRGILFSFFNAGWNSVNKEKFYREIRKIHSNVVKNTCNSSNNIERKKFLKGGIFVVLCVKDMFSYELE